MKGIRGAEGAEAKTPKASMLETRNAPSRDAKGDEGDENWRGFPLPRRLRGLEERRELSLWGPRRSPCQKTDFSTFQASENACR